MIGLFTICRRTKLPRYYWPYSPCWTLHPCDTYFMTGCLNFLITNIFFTCPPLLVAAISCHCIRSPFLFCFVCFVFYILDVSEIVWYLLSFTRLISRSIMPSMSVPAAANGKTSVFYDWVTLHVSVEGHLVCFHILVIIKTATVNTGMNISFWMRVFVS